MELKITSEAVERAAKKCSTAKEVLSELFPEVFKKKDDLVFDFSDKARFESNLYYITSEGKYKKISSKIQIRTNKEYAERGFYLLRDYIWEIAKDEADCMVLIAKEKEKK